MSENQGSIASIPAGALVIPCPAEDFGEFISSLLGNPQVIHKIFKGVFEVSKTTVEDLYHLVDQRVSQQNEAKLISFNVTTSYDDNSSVELTSLKEFVSYNEVKPRISTGVFLQWTYLIKFQGKSVPEKQEINLGFSANFGRPFFAAENDYEPVSFFSSGAGTIFFRIKHTARTWGGDIESLLTDQIENIIQGESKAKKIISKYSSLIGTSATLSVVMASLVGSIFATASFKEALIKNADGKLTQLQPGDIGAKADYIIELMTHGDWHQFVYSITIFLLLSIVVAISIGITLTHFADNRQPSFVLLTKKAGDQRKTSLAKHQRKWMAFIFETLATLALSVFSNWLFVRFFQ